VVGVCGGRRPAGLGVMEGGSCSTRLCTSGSRSRQICFPAGHGCSSDHAGVQITQLCGNRGLTLDKMGLGRMRPDKITDYVRNGRRPAS
jgi:hypothetical protein